MVARMPVQSHGAGPAESEHVSGERSLGMVLALVAPVVIVAWAAAVAGLYTFSHSVAGMSAMEARAFAIGFVTYVFIFIGFVLGLVKLISREHRNG